MKIKAVYFENEQRRLLFNNVSARKFYPVWKNSDGVDCFYDNIGNVRVVRTFADHITKVFADQDFPDLNAPINRLATIKDVEQKVTTTEKVRELANATHSEKDTLKCIKN